MFFFRRSDLLNKTGSSSSGNKYLISWKTSVMWSMLYDLFFVDFKFNLSVTVFFCLSGNFVNRKEVGECQGLVSEKCLLLTLQFCVALHYYRVVLFHYCAVKSRWIITEVILVWQEGIIHVWTPLSRDCTVSLSIVLVQYLLLLYLSSRCAAVIGSNRITWCKLIWGIHRLCRSTYWPVIMVCPNTG